jgi:hypothetical protein
VALACRAVLTHPLCSLQDAAASSGEGEEEGDYEGDYYGDYEGGDNSTSPSPSPSPSGRRLLQVRRKRAQGGALTLPVDAINRRHLQQPLLCGAAQLSSHWTALLLTRCTGLPFKGLNPAC